MEFTKDELTTIYWALRDLLDMHISAMYDVDEIKDKIEGYLYPEDPEDPEEYDEEEEEEERDPADIDPNEPALLYGVLRKNDEVGKILHTGTYASCIEYARAINWTQYYSLNIDDPSGGIIQHLVCPDRMTIW